MSASVRQPWPWSLASVTCALVALGMLWSPGGAATAQEQVPTPPADVELTVEAIQARLKEAEEASDLDDLTKTRVADLYRQALEDLRRADEWAAQSAEFESARLEAPEKLKNIQAELAKPAEEPRPQTPPDASVQQTEQLLAQQEAELKAARFKAAALDEERNRRTERRGRTPEATAAAKLSLDGLTTKLNAALPAADPPPVVRAGRVALRARRQALEKELQSYDREIASYDARGELLTARRDLAAREVTRAEAFVKAWQEVVNERRRLEAEAAARAAEEVRRAAVRKHPTVSELAERNAELARRRTEQRLAEKIDQVTQRVNEVAKEAAGLNAEYQSLKSKLEVAGLTPAMGSFLIQKRDRLPSLRELRKTLAERQSETSHVQYTLLEYEEQRSELVDLDAQMRATLDGLEPTLSRSERADIEAAVRELLQARRALLEALIGDYSTYFTKLVELDYEERRLMAETQRLADYIGERILWIPSTTPPRRAALGHTWEALRWLTAPDRWGAVGQTLWQATRSQPATTLTGLLIFVLVVVAHRRERSALRETGRTAAKGYAYQFLPTVTALLRTVLLAVPGPYVVWLLGWRLGTPLDAPDFVKAVAAGLRSVAPAYLGGEFLRQLCQRDGLAAAHFDWPVRALRLVRRNLPWLMMTALPAAFVVQTVEWTGENSWQNSLGRFAFLAGRLVLLVFVYRLLRPQGGILQERLGSNPRGWLNRLRHVWFAAALGLPVLLGVLSIVGYHYTALQLARQLQATVWLILGLALLNALLLRWLLVSRRKLAIEQARKRREESQEGTPEEPAEPPLDLSSISAQTRNVLRSLLALAFVVGLWLTWVHVLPALTILDRVELWQTTVKTTETVAGANGATSVRLVEQTAPITLGKLGLAVLILLVALIASKNVPGLLEITLLQRLPLEPGERYALTTVSRYVITVLGLVVACGLIGITWSKVQWLAAAITVGLGFGLQEIFANFVSGLILLFERPIRIGDIVTVGNTEGKVTRIRIRATTIRDWDRRELVIPNKEFISGPLVNWTLSDPITRVVVPVGIAYGSDTQRAQDLLLKVARACRYVLGEPAPRAIFRAFGASSLDFELRVFMANRDEWQELVHELHTAIDQEFRRAGIEIAFPQRDIHIRSIRDVLPVANAADEARPAAAQPPAAEPATPRPAGRG